MPGDEPISLNQRQGDRLARATLKIERFKEPQKSKTPSENWQYVRISSTSMTSGMYPGHIFTGNAQAGWSQKALIWIDTPNGEALTAGIYYQAKHVRNHTDGKAIFQTDRIVTSPGYVSTTQDGIVDYDGAQWLGINNATKGVSSLVVGNSATSGNSLNQYGNDVDIQDGNLNVRNAGSGSSYGYVKFCGALARQTGLESIAASIHARYDSGTNSSYISFEHHDGGSSLLWTSGFQSEVNTHYRLKLIGAQTGLLVPSVGYPGPRFCVPLWSFPGGSPTYYDGVTGMLADGSVFVGGILISIGSGGSGTISFGTTPTSGGTTNGVTYTDGTKIQTATHFLIDSGGKPAVKIGSNYASFGEASF
ncbi:MAG: hypothetical protein U0744_02620 [Gemmataceae bacterium]